MYVYWPFIFFVVIFSVVRIKLPIVKVFYNLFQVRPILFEDFDDALHQVRASVSEKDLDLYIQWNKLYGSGTK